MTPPIPQLSFHADYTRIIGRLDAIIREQAGDLIHSHIEQIRGLARAGRHHGDEASLYFQLVNLCEERERTRRLEASSEPSMSFSRLFRSLKEATKRTEPLRRLLALTVNGIAFGMKSTG